ncbi:MAG TPA: protein kinase [Vicinamibacterales bacterium]|nr:protein kinase [Vicinamibacterales bacterium]
MPEHRPDFWNEVEEVFAAALEADAAARPALLDARCGGRDELRAEVDALLAADARAGGFITPHTLPGSDLVPDESRPALDAGSRIGPFRLIARIGQGGMGEIYRAERVDADFTQQVAIKLIAARFHGADAVRRFRAERQILAALHHPHIVALLDGGVTPDGQPYTAMEYVDGQPIAEFCGARALSLEARLRLFQQVCAAVSFAHRHLVVHRDLKPANVLVTGEGDVKVLDFGIAKLLEPGVGAASRTTVLMAPLTPDYASPEQVKGLPVTTACDVYALGVMLYELLTGRRPYETAGRPLDEVVALVVTREPSRPSAAGGGSGVPYDVRRLRGDLDAIVLKAMAKDPARRYGSVADLADDVARFLAKEPVEARPPSMVYIARKTIARHRAAFGIAAVCLVLLTAALAGAVWQARVAARERERAVQRLDDVRELAGALIFRIHDEIAPLAGSTPARQVVVAEGLRFLERLEQDAAGDAEFLNELANAYIRIGNVQGRQGAANLGKYEEARTSYRKAIALAGAAGPSPSARPTLAHANMALANLGGPESLASATEALAIAADWHAREPDSIPATELLARATFFVAQNTAYPDGLPHWQDADRLYHELLERDPGGSGRLRNVALTQKYLGGHFHQAGDWDRALEHYQRAYTFDRRQLDLNQDDLRAQLDLAIDLANVGSVYVMRHEHEQAIEWYAGSLEIRARLAAADPQDVYKRGRLAHVHERLARLYHETERPALARAHIDAALDLLRSFPDATAAVGSVELGRTQMTTGDIARAAGRQAAACAAYEAAVGFYAVGNAHTLVQTDRQYKAEAERQARACGAKRP